MATKNVTVEWIDANGDYQSQSFRFYAEAEQLMYTLQSYGLDAYIRD